MNNIISEINKSNNIVLLCHQNPDGDAIGSIIAMYEILKKLNKKATMVLEGAPRQFSYLKDFDKIITSSNDNYDLAITVDTANMERLNNPDNVISRADKIIVIDHHISNTNYGDINYVRVCPCCTEIIYDLAKEFNIEIDSLIATPLVNGMITDTGNLSHLDVTTNTYKMAYELSKIVDIPKIYKIVLGTITKNQFDLQKIGIEHLEFYHRNTISYTYLTEEDLESCCVPKEEADILANLGRNIEGVEVSIFVRMFNDETRVSMRSNGAEVNEVASIFGGGGHKLAAGFIAKEDIDILKVKLIEEVGKTIDKWNINSK